MSVLSEFVDHAVKGGYVLAIALVCLLQYAVYLHRRQQYQKDAERLKQQLDGLEVELEDVHKDRSLSRLENHILREFVSQTETDKALQTLLRRFVPSSTDGFAAFLRPNPSGFHVAQSRGIDQSTSEIVSISKSIRQRLEKERVLVLEGRELADATAIVGLRMEDSAPVKRLFLFAIGDAPQFLGILLTTSLYPAGAERSQQIELARRLMSSVAANIKRSQKIEEQEDQLRMTSEMLELRAIADKKFDDPSRMLTEFLESLCASTKATRCALTIGTPGINFEPTVFIRCGEELSPGANTRWESHERLLLASVMGENLIEDYDERKLRRSGIDSLIGRAVVASMMHGPECLGLICLTTRDSQPLADRARRLTLWAAEFLGETISRAIRHAAVEKRARVDGLTELANRGEFDQRIEKEILAAQNNGTDVTLLLCDLDRFKQVNDTYGHQAGDEVLRNAARVLKEKVRQIRSGDRALIARYGGEEIAVLLPGIGLAGARRIAESIRQAIQESSVEIDGQIVTVTISIGVATYPLQARNVKDLISGADAALYQAKESGRNQVGFSEAIEV